MKCVLAISRISDCKIFKQNSHSAPFSTINVTQESWLMRQIAGLFDTWDVLFSELVATISPTPDCYSLTFSVTRDRAFEGEYDRTRNVTLAIASSAQNTRTTPRYRNSRSAITGN